jgi:hypothetical protein
MRLTSFLTIRTSPVQVREPTILLFLAPDLLFSISFRVRSFSSNDAPQAHPALCRICIARLYGGGPPLHIPRSLLPTPTHPLTPGFPAPPSLIDPPPGHHPATPRFLLSLLATAVYLSIPLTASQALTAILSSIGPYTVIQYLNFALGKPIRGAGPGEPDAAVGLEDVAQDVTRELLHNIPEINREDLSVSHSLSESDLDIKKVDPSDTSSHSDRHSEYSRAYMGDHTHEELSFVYGAVSDKIGEAAVCWLARWGPDMLQLEMRREDECAGGEAMAGSSSSHLTSHYNVSECTIPVIWARGGLDARWVRALVSADVLFVKGERERYEFAKLIVELRRRHGMDEAEEEEWTKMFSHGIYYANMVRSITDGVFCSPSDIF